MKPEKSVLSRVAKVLAVLVFMAGLIVQSSHRPAEAEVARPISHPLAAYVAEFEMFDQHNGQAVMGKETLTVSASGTARSVIQSFKGGGTLEVFCTSSALFRRTGGGLEYMGKTPYSRWEDYHSPAFLRTLPTFRETAKLLGHEAYVMIQDDPGGRIEVWYLPQMGSFHAVQIVDGQEKRLTALNFTDVSQEAVAPPPDLSVNYDWIERQAAMAEAAGQLEAAARWRRIAADEQARRGTTKQ